MSYIFLVIILFFIEFLYLRLAKKLFIYDKPNPRSSHAHQTIRGGGIIFWITGFFILRLNFPENAWFFAGLSIIAFISFADDLYTLPQLPRFVGHLAGMTLVFVSLNLFRTVPWYIASGAYFLFIGILNAYNFMDGINGITGLYSLTVLGALQWVNLKAVPFITQDFIWFPIIACVVFLIFNFRKRALCFAGDVGSISVAFWIITLLLILIVKTGSIVWLLFLAVYGTDSILTIIHRIFLKQNIFEAHRLHFYQVLANDCRMDHRIISAGYAVVQTLASVFVIFFYNILSIGTLSTLILTPLVILYCLKFRLLRDRVIF